MRTEMMLMALAVLALAGCSKTVTWKEEVQLSDGRVIVVERETLRVSGGPELAHGGSGTTPAERRIRIEFPFGSGQVVEWRSTKMDDRLVPEIPLILDTHEGFVTVISAVSTSSTCDKYVKYAFRNAVWAEEPLPDEFEAMATNLSLLSGPNMPQSISLASKSKELRDTGYAKGLRKVGPKRIACGI